MSCAWIPPAVYVGGPQDGLTAAGAKRVDGTVHPPFRTGAGHAWRGADRPTVGPFYRYQVDPDCGHCRWGRHYVWTSDEEAGR